MHWNELKVGQTIKILERPKMWDSTLCKNNPLHEKIFPYTGKIEEISAKNGGCAKIGDFGWSLDYINFELADSGYELY